MKIERLEFSRDWRNPEDYPTLELDETVVRADMQSLHDETRDYLNNVLDPALEQLSLNVTKIIVCTLLEDKWVNNTQTAVAAGVLVDEAMQLIQLIPASTSRAEYLRCGVQGVEQREDALVFSANLIPTSTLTVYAVVTEVSV